MINPVVIEKLHRSFCNSPCTLAINLGLIEVNGNFATNFNGVSFPGLVRRVRVIFETIKLIIVCIASNYMFHSSSEWDLGD